MFLDMPNDGSTLHFDVKRWILWKPNTTLVSFVPLPVVTEHSSSKRTSKSFPCNQVSCNPNTGSQPDSFSLFYFIFQVFHNCSCVAASGPGNLSAVLGQCPREKCTEMFPYFLALLTICSFLGFFGATPTYMIMFR